MPTKPIEDEEVSFTEDEDIIIDDDGEEGEDDDDDTLETTDDYENTNKKKIGIQDDGEEEIEDGENGEDDDIDTIIETEVMPINENIIPSEERVSKPFLNKYEKTRVLSTRSKQLSLGAKPLVKIDTNVRLPPFEVAQLELKHKMIPYIIRRKMPDGRFELWKISELEDIYIR